MKISRIACLAMCCGLLAGPPALAQQWSPVETEVWNSVEAYWAKDAANDLEGALSLVHENYVGWDTNEPLTSNKSRLRKFLDYNYKHGKTDMYDIQPVDIKIFGDVAVAYYYYAAVTTDSDSKKSNISGRWAEVWKKQDGKWVLIADHGGVTSSEE